MSFRYLGNKTRLADWITHEIEKSVPAGSRVADPMCGTAAISAALADKGYSVVASDALRFPTIHATARLLIEEEPQFNFFGGYARALQWMNGIEETEGYFFREFGSEGQPANGRSPRLYFTGKNAAQIDGLRSSIKELYESHRITHIEHYLLLHHLILAVNRVANISGTYGYFHKRLMANALRDLQFEPIGFTRTAGNHSVIEGEVEVLGGSLSVDAVYLDPPYTKRQYAGNYHILETIAREDEPEAVGDGGLRPWSAQASAFCYKRSAASAFRETLSKLNAPHVFVSYSEDGQVPASELQDLLQAYGKVKLSTMDLARYRSNAHVKAGSVTEHLYHLERE